jgi:2-(1,2-epoxy-1,2-dihydrophenyl)acetyl-CoA isomerase
MPSFPGRSKSCSPIWHLRRRAASRTKQALYASATNTLEAQLDLERDYMRELGYSDDYREGVAFSAKRPPKFIGS